jgi:hypothetical protein
MPFLFLHVLLKAQTMPLSHALFAFLLFLLLLRQSLDEKSGLHSPFSSRDGREDGFFFSLWILGKFDSENSSDPRKQAVPHLDVLARTGVLIDRRVSTLQAGGTSFRRHNIRRH